MGRGGPTEGVRDEASCTHGTGGARAISGVGEALQGGWDGAGVPGWRAQQQVREGGPGQACAAPQARDGGSTLNR